MSTIVANIGTRHLLMVDGTGDGWSVSFHKRIADDWELVADRWADRVEDAQEYIDEFAGGPLTWKDEVSGVEVNLFDFLQENA